MDGRVEQAHVAGRAIPVIWRRTRRAKRITLRIDIRQAAVSITLPGKASVKSGLRLLSDHAAWADDRLAALPIACTLQPGQSVPVHGQPYLICHKPQDRGGAWFDGAEIHVAGEAAFVPRRTQDLLRQTARAVLSRQASAISRDAGLRYSRIVIKDTISRWGSCTRDGVLMFSWRLVMAPAEVQRYVVAHEVAHLAHLDHGPAFWALTRTLSSHHKDATRWLREHGSELIRVRP